MFTHLIFILNSRRLEKMADDIDIEAMLEAPYKKDENKLSSANGHEERSKKQSFCLLGKLYISL
uniref:RNA binding motif protein 39 n=1 Tax=Sus scrofa TaxID=9823 RepID=A0A8D0N1K2_PIG